MYTNSQMLADAKKLVDQMEANREQMEFLMEDLKVSNCEKTLKPIAKFLKRWYPKVEKMLYDANESLEKINKNLQ